MDCKLILISALILLSGSLGVKSQKVISLNEDNWTQILEGEWLVEFFAPWCPACKSLAPIWKQVASWSQDLEFAVGEVDVTTSPGLSGRFMVTALPTIFHVLDGAFRQYKGPRDENGFQQFIAEKKWKEITPIPGWKAPNSIQMSVVSSFFKLSQVLRGVHTHLMVEYGLPNWGSYLIFAFATIIAGAFLGCILVCVIDFVYPPKYVSRHKQTDGADSKPKISEEILADEDIRDDLLDDASNSEQASESENSQDESIPKASSAGDNAAVRKRKPRKD